MADPAAAAGRAWPTPSSSSGLPGPRRRGPVARLPGAAHPGARGGAAFAHGRAGARRTRYRDAAAAVRARRSPPTRVLAGRPVPGRRRQGDRHASTTRPPQIATVAASCPQPDAAETAVIDATAALAAEDRSGPSRPWSGALALFPGSGWLRLPAGGAYRMQDRPEQAIPLLESCWTPAGSRTGARPARSSPTRSSSPASRRPRWTAARRRGALPEALPSPRSTRPAPWPARARRPRRARRWPRAIRKRLDFGGRSRWSPTRRRSTGPRWCAGPRSARRQLRADPGRGRQQRLAEPGDADAALARATALLGLGRFGEAATVLEPSAPHPGRRPVRRIAVAGPARHRRPRRRPARPWSSGRAVAAPARRRRSAPWPTTSAPPGRSLDAATALQWLLRARDQYGVDRLDLALDPDLDPLRRLGLLAPSWPAADGVSRHMRETACRDRTTADPASRNRRCSSDHARPDRRDGFAYWPGALKGPPTPTYRSKPVARDAWSPARTRRRSRSTAARSTPDR